MEVGGQRHAPAAIPPGKTRYLWNRRVGGHQGRSGRLRKISIPPEFDPWTFQPVSIYYTDWGTPTHCVWMYRTAQHIAAFSNLRVFDRRYCNGCVAESSDCVGCHAVSFSEGFPTFRSIIVPSSSRVKQSEKIAGWAAWLLTQKTRITNVRTYCNFSCGIIL